MAAHLNSGGKIRKFNKFHDFILNKFEIFGIFFVVLAKNINI